MLPAESRLSAAHEDHLIVDPLGRVFDSFSDATCCRVLRACDPIKIDYNESLVESSRAVLTDCAHDAKEEEQAA